VGEVRLYEGVKFLGAVDLDVGDVGVGVGEVEVLVGWGWGLVLRHCGRAGSLYVGLCTVGRYVYRIERCILCIKERRMGNCSYLSLSREEV